MKVHIGVDAESGLVRTVNASMMLRRRKRSCVATRNWVSATPGIRGAMLRKQSSGWFYWGAPQW